MPRNFGVRQSASEFWNDGEPERDPKWPYWVIGAATLLLVGIGIFIA
ncbi:hypothetical protein [Bradyrhizobium sp. CCBAU 51753]|nr:hypothetical protein [Bradyrhizobium sp. CCBAU 51753]